MPRNVYQRVYVVGASGFIGSRLMALLPDAGFDARGLNSASMDLMQPDAVEKGMGTLRSADAVVVAAAITRLKDPSGDALIRNVIMMRHLADALRRHPPGQILYLSSQDVYGDAFEDEPVDENTAPRPREPYAVAKLAGEHMLRAAARDAGSCWTILRLPGVYGMGGDGKSVINHLVGRAGRREHLALTGDGQTLRDYLFVDDLVELIARALRERVGGLYNAGPGQPFPVCDVLAFIATSAPAPVPVLPQTPDAADTRRPQRMIADCRRLMERFGWQPRPAVPDGINAYWRQLRNPGSAKGQ